MTEAQFKKLQEQVNRNSKKKINFPEAKNKQVGTPGFVEWSHNMDVPVAPFVSVKFGEGGNAKYLLGPRPPEKHFVVPGPPVPAPRMTRRDKWAKRPCVVRYFEYRDRIQSVVGDLPTVPPVITLEFYIAMPESWSDKMKAAADGKRHLQRGDVDNYSKGVLDSLFLNDGGVSDLTARKRWCFAGQERTVIILG